MKIYLAGPDIFRPDAHEWAASAKALCARYGFEALLPTESQASDPERIFTANCALIRKAQVVIANLNPFRGVEPDSGTAFELGLAYALNKRLFGYIDRMEPLAQRVAAFNGIPFDAEQPRDAHGWSVENFNLPVNLMLAISTHLVEGGLEDCLRLIRARPPGATD